MTHLPSLIASLSLSWLLTVAAVAAPPSPALRHSDVVFMYDDPKQYEAYGCSVLGWAGNANKQHIAQAHAHGVRMFSTSVGFLTEARRVIDFSPDFLDAACRNFEGQPFIVPWLWDFKYKGQPSWWWCTNSPLYRQYLRQRLVEDMKAEPDGLHIDDYRGTSGAVTWREACFCRHCMAGFREYLRQHALPAKLAALGIPDLEKFDYRKFLIDRGVRPEEYRKERYKQPLAAEFLDFQVKADTRFVADYRRMAEEIRGRPLALCVNSGLDDAGSLAIASHLTYFCCEVNHAAARKEMPSHPVYVYKLADGLHRPVAATASGQDWAEISENKHAGLVRTWIALAYAHGQNFMAPHRQWCYTEQKGTHWYAGPAQQYAWLYQFVRRRARLLDGYDAVAQVAVVYDNAARRHWRGDIEPICTSLAARNIPFTVVVAGDDWLDYRLDASVLAGFKAVIVTKDREVDGPQRQLLDQVRAAGRLLVWPADKELGQLVPQPVTVEGADRVIVVPRHRTEAAGSPLVIHLVNTRNDAAKDGMVPAERFRLRLRQDLFGTQPLAQAVLHAPQSESIALKVHQEGGVRYGRDSTLGSLGDRGAIAVGWHKIRGTRLRVGESPAHEQEFLVGRRSPTKLRSVPARWSHSTTEYCVLSTEYQVLPAARDRPGPRCYGAAFSVAFAASSALAAGLVWACRFSVVSGMSGCAAPLTTRSFDCNVAVAASTLVKMWVADASLPSARVPEYLISQRSPSWTQTFSPKPPSASKTQERMRLVRGSQPMISVPPCKRASLPSTLNLRIKNAWLAVQSQAVRRVMPAFEVSLDQSPTSQSRSFKWFTCGGRWADCSRGHFQSASGRSASRGQSWPPGRRRWPRPA